MSWHKMKKYKRYLLAYLSTSVALLVGTQAQALGQFISPVEINQLAIPQNLTIPPITQSEISVAINGDQVTNPGDLFAPPQFNTLIVREFPNVWQMRVPIDQLDSLYATYELKAPNGSSNAVVSEQRSSAAMPVVVEPLPIMEISRDPNSNTAVVQGGFRLKLDISSAQFAGAYTGELTVTVDRR